jgi:Fis family transcriptional regulator, factor for inversion stimulation protein
MLTKRGYSIMSGTETAEALTIGQEIGNQATLKNSVEKSIQSYFSKIGDTLVDNLYELVLAEIEEPLLKEVISFTRGNQSKAAILLGLSRGTLRKKLKIYGFLK